MSSGIRRIHGRTFLQNYLCKDVFHKGYENSVFNVTYNFNGSSMCGGGFWGGFAGGLGMGLGAGLMGMLGRWMGGFGNMCGGMFGGFGGMFGGFPMLGNFGCFGGGFPMMNWWGGSFNNTKSGNTSDSGSTSGGSGSSTNYSRSTSSGKTSKEKASATNYDREPLNALEQRIKELRDSDSVDNAKFKELYLDVYNYTMQDKVEKSNDKSRLKSFKKQLDDIAQEHNLTKPTKDEIKQDAKDKKAKKKNDNASSEVQQQQAAEKDQVQTQVKADENPSVTKPKTTDREEGAKEKEKVPTMAERISNLNPQNVDELLELYQTASGKELGQIETKFENYINTVQDIDKLNDIKNKVKNFSELLNIVDDAIDKLEPEEQDDNKAKAVPTTTLDPLIRAEYSGYGFTDQEILTLNDIGSIDIDKDNHEFFRPKKPLSLEALNILSSKNINVAFAYSEKSQIDSYIIGKPGDIKTNEKGEVTSYTIDCNNFGEFGLKYSVVKNENDYTITCISEEEDTDYVLFKAANGRRYIMGEDGVLNYADGDKGPVVATEGAYQKYNAKDYEIIPPNERS